MVNQEYGGLRNLKAFIGKGEFADRRIMRPGAEKAAEGRQPPSRCKAKLLKPEARKRGSERSYANPLDKINGAQPIEEQS